MVSIKYTNFHQISYNYADKYALLPEFLTFKSKAHT